MDELEKYFGIIDSPIESKNGIMQQNSKSYLSNAVLRTEFILNIL